VSKQNIFKVVEVEIYSLQQKVSNFFNSGIEAVRERKKKGK
jgi:hypothetical protein